MQKDLIVDGRKGEVFPPYVVGVDPSSRAIGVVVVDRKLIWERPLPLVMHFTCKSSVALLEDRLIILAREFRMRFSSFQQPFWAAVERPPGAVHGRPHRADTGVVVGMAAGVVIAVLWQVLGYQGLTLVNPGKAKAALTGRAVIPKVTANWCARSKTEIPELTEHECDALGVALAVALLLEEEIGS